MILIHELTSVELISASNVIFMEQVPSSSIRVTAAAPHHVHLNEHTTLNMHTMTQLRSLRHCNTQTTIMCVAMCVSPSGDDHELSHAVECAYEGGSVNFLLGHSVKIHKSGSTQTSTTTS